MKTAAWKPDDLLLGSELYTPFFSVIFSNMLLYIYIIYRFVSKKFLLSGYKPSFLIVMFRYVPSFPTTSGKLSHNYGKSPCYSWVNPLFLWPFSRGKSCWSFGKNPIYWE